MNENKILNLKGGVWLKDDATVSPSDLLQTFATESKKNGIQIIENCEVTKVLVKGIHLILYI